MPKLVDWANKCQIDAMPLSIFKELLSKRCWWINS